MAFTQQVQAPGRMTLRSRRDTSNAKAEGRFDKRDFIYIAKDDEYRCPAGRCTLG
jgi:hypothetical protein